MQTRFLRAALWDGDIGRHAFEQWRSDADIEALDFETHRLLPLLYRNMLALGIDDPEQARFKGVYRHYWSANQLLLRDSRIALEGFRDTGIETLVFQGAALAALYYRDAGARPIERLDVLVRRADARRAVEAAAQSEFLEIEATPLERRLSTGHATLLRNQRGSSVQLHWYALPQSVGDDDLWEASAPAPIADVETRVLCPTHQLLHTCLHGVTPGSLGWVADATVVLQTQKASIDWDLLVERARVRGLADPLASALAQVREYVDAPVPESVVAALAAIRSTRSQRWAYRVATRPPRRGGSYVIQWDRYRRLRAASVPGVPATFAAYLCEWLGTAGYGGLIRLLARKAARASLPRFRSVRSENANQMSPRAS